MPDHSGGPWDAQAPTAAPLRDSSERTPLGGRSGGLPPFPSDQAENLIQLISRFAGPAVFFFVLGMIAWAVIK